MAMSAAIIRHVTATTFAASTPEERRTWLFAWADANPEATISAARMALEEHFGCTIGNKDISSIMREARKKMKDIYTRSRPPGPPAPGLALAPAPTTRLDAGATTITGMTANDLLVASGLASLSSTSPIPLQALATILKAARIKKVEFDDGGGITIFFVTT